MSVTVVYPQVRTTTVVLPEAFITVPDASEGALFLEDATDLFLEDGATTLDTEAA